MSAKILIHKYCGDTGVLLTETTVDSWGEAHDMIKRETLESPTGVYLTAESPFDKGRIVFDSGYILSSLTTKQKKKDDTMNTLSGDLEKKKSMASMSASGTKNANEAERMISTRAWGRLPRRNRYERSVSHPQRFSMVCSSR